MHAALPETRCLTKAEPAKERRQQGIPRNHDRNNVISFVDKARPAGQSALGQIDNVFAHYDLLAISPRTIDELAQDLLNAGYEDTQFVAMLSATGQRFLSKVGKHYAEQGYRVTVHDEDAKVDLLQISRDQLTIKKMLGQPTLALEDFILKLESIQAEKP